MAGIKDLTADRVGGGIPIDDVLERLDRDTREHLEMILLEKLPNGKHAVPRDEIVRACAEDGFVVTDWSIRMWRRRNGDR